MFNLKFCSLVIFLLVPILLLNVSWATDEISPNSSPTAFHRELKRILKCIEKYERHKKNAFTTIKNSPSGSSSSVSSSSVNSSSVSLRNSESRLDADANPSSIILSVDNILSTMLSKQKYKKLSYNDLSLLILIISKISTQNWVPFNIAYFYSIISYANITNLSEQKATSSSKFKRNLIQPILHIISRYGRNILQIKDTDFLKEILNNLIKMAQNKDQLNLRIKSIILNDLAILLVDENSLEVVDSKIITEINTAIKIYSNTLKGNDIKALIDLVSPPKSVITDITPPSSQENSSAIENTSSESKSSSSSSSSTDGQNSGIGRQATTSKMKQNENIAKATLQRLVIFYNFAIAYDVDDTNYGLSSHSSFISIKAKKTLSIIPSSLIEMLNRNHYESENEQQVLKYLNRVFQEKIKRNNLYIYSNYRPLDRNKKYVELVGNTADMVWGPTNKSSAANPKNLIYLFYDGPEHYLKFYDVKGEMMPAKYRVRKENIVGSDKYLNYIMQKQKLKVIRLPYTECATMLDSINNEDEKRKIAVGLLSDLLEKKTNSESKENSTDEDPEEDLDL